MSDIAIIGDDGFLRSRLQNHLEAYHNILDLADGAEWSEVIDMADDCDTIFGFLGLGYPASLNSHHHLRSAIQNDLITTVNVLEAARRNGVRCFIILAMPWNRAQQLLWRSVEDLCALYRSEHYTKATVVQLYHVYGEMQPTYFSAGRCFPIVPGIICSVLDNKPIFDIWESVHRYHLY